MNFREFRKDQFIELLGEHGKSDVLDIVPWEHIRAADFEDEEIGGICQVRTRNGEEWLEHIRIKADVEGLEALLIVLHESSHSLATVAHDRRFAAACWGLVLRSGVFSYDDWRAWINARAYDLQDDPDGRGWASGKALQLARSNPLMFRIRLFRLGFNDFIFYRNTGIAVGVLAMFSFVLSSYWR